MTKRLDPQKVWEYTKKKLLDRMPFNLAVMDALNAAVPITVEEKLLVLGLPKDQTHNRGHLETPEQRNMIEQILREALGEGFSFTVIDGTTQEEWEFIRDRRDAAKRAVQEEFAEKRRTSAITRSFTDLSRELAHRQAQMSGHKFPHMKAAFLLDAMPLIRNVENNMKADPNLNDAEFHRQFARVFDKLAVMLDMPASVIAVEYLRYCREQGEPHSFDTNLRELLDSDVGGE